MRHRSPPLGPVGADSAVASRHVELTLNANLHGRPPTAATSATASNVAGAIPPTRPAAARTTAATTNAMARYCARSMKRDCAPRKISAATATMAASNHRDEPRNAIGGLRPTATPSSATTAIAVTAPPGNPRSTNHRNTASSSKTRAELAQSTANSPTSRAIESGRRPALIFSPAGNDSRGPSTTSNLPSAPCVVPARLDARAQRRKAAVLADQADPPGVVGGNPGFMSRLAGPIVKACNRRRPTGCGARSSA